MATKITQGPWTRVRPLQRDELDPYTEAGMAVGELTWGKFRNNLCKVMAYTPRMLQTEVEYCNSFIFDPPTFRGDVQEAGFVDRPLKELVISRTSLANRSLYSITHHAFIGWMLHKGTEREASYFEKYLHLHEHEKHLGTYTQRESLVLDFTLKVTNDFHSVSDDEFSQLKQVLHEHCQKEDPRFVKLLKEQQDRHVLSQISELTWLIGHFCLLNRWFTVLQVPDENAEDEDNFSQVYADTVPEQIRQRNADVLAGKL